MSERNKIVGLALLLALLIAGVDQCVKGLVVRSLALNESLPIIPRLLELTHTHNTGSAFGLFRQAPPGILLGLSVLVLGCFLFLIKPYLTSRAGLAVTALVLGGAFGNMIDRLTRVEMLPGAARHYVVDYIYFHIGDAFRWPVFNLADACVVVGVGLLIIVSLRQERGKVATPGGDPV